MRDSPKYCVVINNFSCYIALLWACVYENKNFDSPLDLKHKKADIS